MANQVRSVNPMVYPIEKVLRALIICAHLVNLRV